MKKRAIKKKTLISRRNLLAAGLIIILAGVLSYLLLANNSPTQNGATTGTASDGSKVNLNPPTAADTNSNAAHKSEILQKDQQVSSGSSQSGSVSVVITEATSTVVKAYVSGVFEDGGACTAKATQGSQTVTASSSGFENVSYTQCSPMNWPSTLGGGTWSITVSYKSSTSQGSQTISKTL